MTPKFTPGPWRALHARDSQNPNCQCGQVWSVTADVPVCSVVSSCDEFISPDAAFVDNIRLIAKAPAMYKELRRLQEVVGEEDAKIIEQLLSEIDGED